MAKEIRLKPGDYIHQVTKEFINESTTRYEFQRYLCLKISEKNKGKRKAILTGCGFTPGCWDNIYNYDDLKDYDLEIVETSLSSAEPTSDNTLCLRWSWDDGVTDIPQDESQSLGSNKTIVKHYRNQKEHYDYKIELHPGDYLKKVYQRKPEIPDGVKPLILRNSLEEEYTQFDEYTFIVLAVSNDDGWPVVTVAPVIHYVDYYEICVDFNDALKSNTIIIHPEAECHAVFREYRDREPTVRRFLKMAHHWEWNCGDALLPYHDPEYPNPRYSHIVDITIHKDLINDYTSDNHEEDYYVSEVDDNSAARKDYLYNMHIKCLNN